MTFLTQTSIKEAFKNEETSKRTAAQIAQDITTGSYDISHFVEQLGFALTSTSVEDRVNGTILLTDTLAALPKNHLNATQLEFLTTFYSDRMKDHHNVIPTVIDGIDALIGMTQIPAQSLIQMLQSFFQQICCQSQVRSDRAKIFKIFKCLSEQHVEAVKSMSGDFIYSLINSIDGERDPRNLDFIFSFMPDFISKFSLLHLSEEMFEIFACYFPIDFNANKSDPDTITRDNLAQKLINCLVASPEFIEWTVALALEKLDSDLVQAKLDSLELLNQAALKFAPSLLVLHFDQIWLALKIEIYPGSDNADIIQAGLRTLRAVLEQASSASEWEISHNYQTCILGTILPHLSDVNERLFNPSTAIALVCIAGDPEFACTKILNTFLIKLKAGEESAETTLNDEQRIKMYTIIAQIYKIVGLRGSLEQQAKSEICAELHAVVIAALRRNEGDKVEQQNLDLKRAALSVLNECTPIISEPNRALVYKALVQLITHDVVDLEFTHLLEQLGALYPIELQSNCINVCIRNFALFSNFVKRKIYTNLLPLTKQMAFTQLVLDLIFGHIFQTETSNDVRLLALEALHSLLAQEDSRFIIELQANNCLIDKLVTLAQTVQLELPLNVLEQIAAVLSLIVQQLPLAEQYMVATEYLPKLNLKLASDLFLAKGLLGFLHQNLSLDDHFERLLDDLTNLSLASDNAQLRQVAHHLLCSLANKFEYNEQNRNVLARIVKKLREAIAKEDAKAVEALSWLAKGLIVRGCEEAGDVIEALAELLDHPSLFTAASLAFEIISAEYPQLHLPIVRFLFKQKFFHTIITKLGQKLETYCEHHVNAFIYVLKTTPHAVLKMNIEKIGPILFKSLDSTKVHTLCIALEICENFIKQQDEYFRSHLNHIIPSCLQLSIYPPSMQVRITALNLLYDITKYPTFVLLPLRMDVVLGLSSALDDPKRLVRNAAVRASNSWFLIGAPNTE